MFAFATCEKKKTHHSRSSRQTTGQTARPDNDRPQTSDADFEPDATGIRQQTIARFAAACRQQGHWKSDDGHLFPVLLTRLPAWRDSGLLLEILEQEHPPLVLGDEAGRSGLAARPVIRLRRDSDHYRAVVNGTEVNCGADGNCFFYALWYALENSTSDEMRRQIYRSNLPVDKWAASAYFRNEIADYALVHQNEIFDFLTYTAAAQRSIIAPDVPRCYESETVPFVLKEAGRCLFHSAQSLTSTLGSSLLIGECLNTFYRLLGPLFYWPAQLYFLYNTLKNQREYIDAFLTALSLLPYHLFSGDNIIFSVADTARQIFEHISLVSGAGDQSALFWIAVGALALMAHGVVFARLDVDTPHTRMGQLVTAFFQQLRRVPQLYGLLETIHSATPHSATPVPALYDDGTTKSSPTDIQARADARELRKQTLLHRPVFRLPPEPLLQSDGTFINTRQEQQVRRQTAHALVAAWRGNRPSTASNEIKARVSFAPEAKPAIVCLPVRNTACEFEIPRKALAATDLTGHSANVTVQESNIELPDASLYRLSQYSASAPLRSIASTTSRAIPVVALTALTAGAAAVTGVHGNSGTSAITLLVALIFLSVGRATGMPLGIEKKKPDSDIEPLLADAVSADNTYFRVDPDMHTPRTKWMHLKRENLTYVAEFLRTQFDHGFFEDALEAILDQKSNNPPPRDEKSTYESFVLAAWHDYMDDSTIPLHYRTSEDRYGDKFYSILLKINQKNKKPPYGAMHALKEILIKIKAEETFIIRDRQGIYRGGRNGIIVKLESVFELPIELPELPFSTQLLDNFMDAQLGHGSVATAPLAVVEGVSEIISLWNNQANQIPIIKSGISDETVYKIRQTTKNRVINNREKIYKLRNPRNQKKLDKENKELLKRLYALHYLEKHINLCQNFLSVLTQIEPVLPSTTTAPRHAIVFEARALAVDAALQMLGNNQTLPIDIDNMSKTDQLNNFILLTGSSPDVTAFISFAEAIFYKVLTGKSTDEIYDFYKNPVRLLIDFKNRLKKIPFKSRYGSVINEGIQFIKDIASNDNTPSDSDYYNQFVKFRQKYQRPLARALSLSALLENGQHPYWILTERPITVVHTTIYVKPKWPLPDVVDSALPLGNALTLSRYMKSLYQSSSRAGYVEAGRLIFCQLASRDWIVISTVGGRCVIASVTDNTMKSNSGLSNISTQETVFLMPKWLDGLTPLGMPIPYKSHPLWMNNNLFKEILHPIFQNETVLEEKMVDGAYLSWDRTSPRDILKNKLILTISDNVAAQMLRFEMSQKKESDYHRKWWQYITSLIPMFDMIHRASNDPDYTPSASEITIEAVSDIFILLSIAIPGGEIAATTATVLRNAIVANLARGLRGMRLLTAVLAEIAPGVSHMPLHLLAISGYQLFAFWEPLPLKRLAVSIYRGARKFRFNFKLNPIPPGRVADIDIATLHPGMRETTGSARTVTNEARGLLAVEQETDFQYYEFSYSYENKVLPGTRNLPNAAQVEPRIAHNAGPGAPDMRGEQIVAGSYGKLKESWRCNGISLDQASLGDEGGRYEGIYAIPVAGHSTYGDEWKYYIQEAGFVYEVRWSIDIHSWRVVDPRWPGRLGHATPVQLDRAHHWVTHADLPGKGGAPLSGIRHPTHLIDMTELQSHEVRTILTKSRKHALNHIDRVLRILQRKRDTKKVDEALDIFMGRHTDAVKEKLQMTLADVREFLEKTDISQGVFYRAGYYEGNPKVVAVTELRAALGGRKTGPPAITIFVDAIAGISYRKSVTKNELENFMATVLIHESYHATGVETPDLGYAIISGDFFDVAPVAKLSEPLLRGENVREIITENKISEDEFNTRIARSNINTRINPDNLAFLATLIGYIGKHPSKYTEFISEYQRWISDVDSPLRWRFVGSGKGPSIQLTHTDIGDLLRGDITPLTKNGDLFGGSSSDIEPVFEAVRHDQTTSNANQPQTFSRSDNVFLDVLSTWKGGEITSLGSDGVWSGTWGQENLLNNDVSIIEVGSGKSGAVAIRIKLTDVAEGHPIIVSGGQLSGSTIAFTVDEHYFYAFHAGKIPGDQHWRPDQEGIASIYHIYLALGGEEIPGLRISDDMLLVNERNELAGNRGLVDILKKFESGFFAFSGKSPDSSPATLGAARRIGWFGWFDYASAGTADSVQEKGRAYALLARQSGALKISAYAEDASSIRASGKGNGKGKPKPAGMQFVLKSN